MFCKMSDWYKQNVVRHQGVKKPQDTSTGILFWNKRVKKLTDEAFKNWKIWCIPAPPSKDFQAFLAFENIHFVQHKPFNPHSNLFDVIKLKKRLTGKFSRLCYIPELTICTNSRLPRSISRPDKKMTYWLLTKRKYFYSLQ